MNAGYPSIALENVYSCVTVDGEPLLSTFKKNLR